MATTTKKGSKKKRFFREESGRELKEGKQIEQATPKKGVAYARPRTLPAADGIAGTMEGDRS
jgi:hypothetical protein